MTGAEGALLLWYHALTLKYDPLCSQFVQQDVACGKRDHFGSQQTVSRLVMRKAEMLEELDLENEEFSE